MKNKIQIGENINVYPRYFERTVNVANLLLDLNTLDLKLLITQDFRVGKKPDKGDYVAKVLCYVDVGKITKPNKGLIRSTLSKHKHQYTFGKNWSIVDKDIVKSTRNQVSDVLEYTLKNNILVSRVIKLKKILSKLN